jgi:hypothetical protein
MVVARLKRKLILYLRLVFGGMAASALIFWLFAFSQAHKLGYAASLGFASAALTLAFSLMSQRRRADASGSSYQPAWDWFATGHIEPEELDVELERFTILYTELSALGRLSRGHKERLQAKIKNLEERLAG